MSDPATIDHKEVHVNLSKHGPNPVTTQPSATQASGEYAGNVSYNTQTAMAVFVDSPPPILAQKMDPKMKPKDFVITSCFIIFACNFIFGLIGYHFGVKSNYAWQLGDIHQARRQAKKALVFVILGAIIGVATYTLAFVLYFVVFDKPDHDVETQRP